MNEENQPSKKELQKEQSRDAVENVGKQAGKMYLEAHGVPPGLSDLAVNQAAKDPRIKMAVNKVANNPIVRHNATKLNRANSALQMANGMKQGGVQGQHGSNAGLKSGSDEFKDMAGKMANPKKAAADAIGNKINGNSADGKKQDKTESESTLKEKDAKDEAQNFKSGNFTLQLKRTTLLKIALIASLSGFVMLVFVSVLSMIADTEGASIVMGEMASEDKDLVKSIITGDLDGEVFTDTGNGTGNSVGRGDDPLYEYYERFKVLGNVFSSEFRCYSSECMTRAEYLYYLKVADIALRYKNKYGINLNWVLLNATVMYNQDTQEDIMDAHLNNYNEDDIENYDILMNLDWDYDYKKISGYTYLSPKDYRYDLQILAKNMVRKTTTQTCTKYIYDDKGNLIGTEIVAEQTDLDIEEQYFEKGQPYYLTCPAGTEYNIHSNYKLDSEKYDEFLLEYIENKFYLKDLPGINEEGNTDMTPSPASGEYIFPLPSGATTCRSSAYGPRIHPITGKYHNHSGDDYPAAAGTPVYAVADGTVSAAGFDNSMGNYVIVDHAGGVKSIYMHASKLYVSSGAKIKQGDVIMAVGTTGSSTGNHLHITFKLNNETVNPANYIGALKMCY